MTENIYNLWREENMCTHEIQRVSNRINIKTLHQNITIKIFFADVNA